MTETVQFHLEAFDGPLDLLLQLIHKNKVSIYDIPIAEILEQYMEVLRQMQSADMDVAGDFIAMAAQLMLIKSRMLLPKEQEEEEEDPRAELVEQPLERKRKFEGILPLEKLEVASRRMFERVERALPPSTEAFQGIVGRERVPVHTKITSILLAFRKKSTLRFQSLFFRAQSRSDIVATFLAVLELSKTRRVMIEGDGEETSLSLREDMAEEETDERTAV